MLKPTKRLIQRLLISGVRERISNVVMAANRPIQLWIAKHGDHLPAETTIEEQSDVTPDVCPLAGGKHQGNRGEKNSVFA
jgi:hypothetical protein